jgi:FMN phosphatase YigB (HAD superfamily)
MSGGMHLTDKKRKIIFDLDETLYADTSLRQRREQAILDFLGDKKKKYLELRQSMATIASLNKLGISKEVFYSIIEKVEINLKHDKKLRKILEKLGERFELIVLSNVSKNLVRKTLEKIGIIDLIDDYYGADCFKQQKPHAGCFSMVKRGDICIGNNYEKDLEVPGSMGAITILVGKKDKRPDFCAKNIYKIERIISEMERVLYPKTLYF